MAKREGESEEEHFNKCFHAVMFLWSDLLRARTNYLFIAQDLSDTHTCACTCMQIHTHARTHTHTQAQNTSMIICLSYISSVAEKQVLEEIFFKWLP